MKTLVAFVLLVVLAGVSNGQTASRATRNSVPTRATTRATTRAGPVRTTRGPAPSRQQGM